MESCKEYCKECIHNNICDLQKIIIENRDSCEHFKDRNRFVALPKCSDENEIVGSTPEQPEITEEQLRQEWVNYKKKDLAGLLIELPCKVGDNIFKIGKFIEGIKILSVDHFRIFGDCVELMSDPWDGGICETHQVGKIVKEEFDWNGYFLSKEEAEQALNNSQKSNS